MSHLQKCNKPMLLLTYYIWF